MYNVGGKNEWANIDIVRLVCSLVDDALQREPSLIERFPDCLMTQGRSSQELITFVTDRLAHDRRYAINPRKIERELGFVPTETFELGVCRTVDWFLANESWWRGAIELGCMASA